MLFFKIKEICVTNGDKGHQSGLATRFLSDIYRPLWQLALIYFLLLISPAPDWTVDISHIFNQERNMSFNGIYQL